MACSGVIVIDREARAGIGSASSGKVPDIMLSRAGVIPDPGQSYQTVRAVAKVLPM